MLRKFTPLLGLAFLTPNPAHADAYCSGLVYEALTYANGDIMILTAWRGDWTVVCNINAARGGVSTSTCFGWFSQIQTAVSQKHNLGIYYGGIAQAECATLPTYSTSSAPIYVRSPQ